MEKKITAKTGERVPIFVEDDVEITKETLEKLIEQKKKNLLKLEKVSGKNSTYIEELSELTQLQLTAGNYEESERNYLICLKHFEKQSDRLGQAAVLGLLGTLHYRKEQYDDSIEYYQKAYQIYNELLQMQEKIMCLKGIGGALIKKNDLKKACDTFLECSTLCSDCKDPYSLLDCFGQLVHINESLNKWDVVFEIYKKSLKVFKELNDIQGIITSYFNLGILKKRVNSYSDALRYFKKGTNIAIDSNFSELIIKGLTYVGECLFYTGEIKSAKNEFVKALKIAKKIDAKNAILQIRIILTSFGLNDVDIEKELETQD